VAEVQGATGLMARWEVAGPISTAAAASLVAQTASPGQVFESRARGAARWQTLYATGAEARLRIEEGSGVKPDSVWLGFTDFILSEPATVQLLASSNGKLRIWANGKLVYHRSEVRPFQPDSDRFPAELGPGSNRLVVKVASSPHPPEFHVRFRRKSSTIEHERLVQMALTRGGDPDRGRQIFNDVEKSLCLKCHWIGGRGERIGPELSGIGGRFSRITMIESILEPSRTIAPSFDSMAVALKDGRVVSGVRVAETETMVTLADQEGRKHALSRADIEELRPQPLSIMPEGLEKRLTPEEFVDLIAFLVSQK
jgi:putative heme-binding domain-containing protein